MVSYFAGIFYIVRLLIYHTEALQGKEGQERDILHKQYSFMEERLWNLPIMGIPVGVPNPRVDAYQAPWHRPALGLSLLELAYPQGVTARRDSLQLGQATYGQ